MTAPGAKRTAPRLVLAAIALVLLALPAIVVSTSATASADPLWTALRLAALEALTLLLGSVLIGAFRPPLNQLLGPAFVQQVHVSTGMAGLCLAAAHAIMLLFFGLAGYEHPGLWLGPTAFALLALATAIVLSRRRLRYFWRWLHRMNYLAVAVAVPHALRLGHDLRDLSWLKIWFLFYGIVAVLGLAYSMVRLARKRASR